MFFACENRLYHSGVGPTPRLQIYITMALPELATFWNEENPSALRCLLCREPFKDRALIRTLKVRDDCESAHGSAGPAYSRAILIEFGRSILLFDRHLECLLKADVQFVAVSHVWDANIAQMQQCGYYAPQNSEATRLAIQGLVQIYEGSRRDSDEPTAYEWEFWHDYFSVPQWTDRIKNMILLTIHEIFSHARSVIVHLEDVESDTVNKLYHGETTKERLEGMTGICNAKWFSRMWTAMELIRSREIKTMMANGRLAGPNSEPVFLDKLAEVWADEVRKRRSVYSVEADAQMGKNLVPWNLGPLREAKELKRTNFAMAFAVLSRRGCRDRRDFLHAFRSIVVGGTKIRPLHPYFWDEFIHTAKDCLLVDDYSPLLITPDLPMGNPIPPPGYNDVTRWELGAEQNPPNFKKAISIDEFTGQVSVNLEHIGTVISICERTDEADCWGSLAEFASCVDLVLELDGPDLTKFVNSVGGRLFGEDTDFILSRLRDKGIMEELQSVLRERHRFRHIEKWPKEGEHGTKWLVKMLSLSLAVRGRSESRLALLGARYQTMHCRPHGYVISIHCDTCGQTSAFRIGSFVRKQQLLGTKAFRIPGLKYDMSLPNGMALLEKDGRIIGRMLWATPACPCHVTHDVKLWLPDYIAPQPNTT